MPPPLGRLPAFHDADAFLNDPVIGVEFNEIDRVHRWCTVIADEILGYYEVAPSPMRSSLRACRISAARPCARDCDGRGRNAKWRPSLHDPQAQPEHRRGAGPKAAGGHRFGLDFGDRKVDRVQRQPSGGATRVRMSSRMWEL